MNHDHQDALTSIAEAQAALSVIRAKPRAGLGQPGQTGQATAHTPSQDLDIHYVASLLASAAHKLEGYEPADEPPISMHTPGAKRLRYMLGCKRTETLIRHAYAGAATNPLAAALAEILDEALESFE